jgi:hypothetical protein
MSVAIMDRIGKASVSTFIRPMLKNCLRTEAPTDAFAHPNAFPTFDPNKWQIRKRPGTMVIAFP